MRCDERKFILEIIEMEFQKIDNSLNSPFLFSDLCFDFDIKSVSKS